MRFSDNFSFQETTENNQYKKILKVVFLGASGVGKTNIFTRIDKNEFREDSKATIGVDFAFKEVQFQKDLYKIQIWDTAGQERYKNFTKGYLGQASIILMVYDITERNSFNDINKWIIDVKDILDIQKIVIVLIGNKKDLNHQRQIGENEGKNVAKKNGYIFLEISAKDSPKDDILIIFKRIFEELKN